MGRGRVLTARRDVTIPDGRVEGGVLEMKYQDTHDNCNSTENASVVGIGLGLSRMWYNGSHKKTWLRRIAPKYGCASYSFRNWFMKDLSAIG